MSFLRWCEKSAMQSVTPGFQLRSYTLQSFHHAANRSRWSKRRGIPDIQERGAHPFWFRTHTGLQK